MPKPLRLVEKGVLKSYLLTRQPVRGFEGSNGRARLPGSFGASTASLQQSVRERVRDRAGRRAEEEADRAVRTREASRTASSSARWIFRRRHRSTRCAGCCKAAQGGRPVSIPLLVYKVFPDGREELVRGVRFRGLNVRSLKDILAAGDDTRAFEFMDNTAPFALIGGGWIHGGGRVIAPSILIDDLELHPIEEELPKLPVVPPPDADAQGRTPCSACWAATSFARS